MSDCLPRKPRVVLVAEYLTLRAQGLTIAEIADRYGKTRQAVANLLADPHGSKQRARRRRYQGRCIDCGAATDGSNGRAAAPKRCAACHLAFELADRYWTRERVIEAIRAWAADHDGEPPRAVEDWRRADPDGRWPAGTGVYRNKSHPHAPFASWSEALAAAGFPGHTAGTRRERNREAWRANLSAAQRRRWQRIRGSERAEMVNTSLNIETRALAALDSLNGASRSEHIRRAIDMYLAAVEAGEGNQRT